jgi:putative ABC transport system ATP-binding protein
MCVVIAKLGERLRQMAREAHLSLAMLAAYLNDVWFIN